MTKKLTCKTLKKNSKKRYEKVCQIETVIFDFKVYQLLAQYFHSNVSLSINNQTSLVQIDMKVCNRKNTRKLLGKFVFLDSDALKASTVEKI